MTRRLALIRGINVGGRTVLPMARLREIAAGLGWESVETVIQSGNLIFEARGDAAKLESALEHSLAEELGFAPAVMVRDAAAWRATLVTNPFPAESASEPNRVTIGVTKRPLAAGAADALMARATNGERLAAAGGVLWFHFPAGAGASQLTPARIDKASGSPLTARNWRTATRLADMLGGRP